MQTSRREKVAALFEEERELHRLLSQETRHYIVQFVLAHPEHLLSLDELDYAVSSKAKASIRSQLDRLIEAGIIAEYTHEPSAGKRDLPSNFYGFADHGIEVLERFQYIEALPVLRALYDNMEKSARVQRHEDAPRPELPGAVEEALSFDEDVETDRDVPETTSFGGESAEGGSGSAGNSEEAEIADPDGGLDEHLDFADD
jgi:DNA-binding transcriptional ArsR family regulator